MSLISLQLVSTSTELVISLTQAKLFLKVDSDHDDALIIDMIKAVSCQFERYTGRALLQQLWCARYAYSRHQTAGLLLPIIPAHEVVKIMLHDAYGESRQYEGKYHLNGDMVVMHYIPNAEQLSIDFNAGSAIKASEIPEDIANALLQHLAFLYDNRGAKFSYTMENYNEYKRYRC